MGTIMEVICVGIVSWLAYGLLLNVVFLALRDQLQSHLGIGYLSWALGIISLSLGGYAYGLKRQRTLNPLFVLLG